jgi:hypothetical protein
MPMLSEHRDGDSSSDDFFLNPIANCGFTFHGILDSVYQSQHKDLTVLFFDPLR